MHTWSAREGRGRLPSPRLVPCDPSMRFDLFCDVGTVDWARSPPLSQLRCIIRPVGRNTPNGPFRRVGLGSSTRRVIAVIQTSSSDRHYAVFLFLSPRACCEWLPFPGHAAPCSSRGNGSAPLAAHFPPIAIRDISRLYVRRRRPLGGQRRRRDSPIFRSGELPPPHTRHTLPNHPRPLPAVGCAVWRGSRAGQGAPRRRCVALRMRAGRAPRPPARRPVRPLWPRRGGAERGSASCRGSSGRADPTATAANTAPLPHTTPPPLPPRSPPGRRGCCSQPLPGRRTAPAPPRGGGVRVRAAPPHTALAAWDGGIARGWRAGGSAGGGALQGSCLVFRSSVGHAYISRGGSGLVVSRMASVLSSDAAAAPPCSPPRLPPALSPSSYLPPPPPPNRRPLGVRVPLSAAHL